MVARGYEPKTVRLHYDVDDPEQRPLIEAACRKLQAEMLEWSAGRRQGQQRFDGTILSLSRLYQTDPASPHQLVKWNTRRNDLQVLRAIEKAVGSRALSALKIGDFRRWYDAAKEPKQPGGPERLRKAYGIIKMLRQLFSYGIMAELPECARLKAILDEARFRQPARRREKLELTHVEAFVAKAIEMGRVSLALGTALQFETTLRQRDVIGEWEPVPEGETPSGIVLGGRRWARGLTWQHISPALVLTKETTKTGATVTHDLTLCPIVLRVLEWIPAEQRVGPVIIDETVGRPYAEHAYAREWRKVARAAGIPDHIRNMDARAGGISEADEAGADLDAIRSAAGHSQASTTARYVRGTGGKARKVAELRLAHRKAREQDVNRR